MIRAEHLTCEYEENPVGVGTRHPALGWQITGDPDRAVETGYRLVAAEEDRKSVV